MANETLKDFRKLTKQCLETFTRQAVNILVITIKRVIMSTRRNENNKDETALTLSSYLCASFGEQ